MGNLRLEAESSRSDEVVPYVNGTTIPLTHRTAARALHALQRDAHLTLTGTIGELLDGLAVLIPAGKIHAAVDASRVAVQHLLDLADALEEATPVERGAESQTGNRIRHRRLV